MDLNGDGNNDIISGTYSNYDGETGEGYFQVLYGRENGELSKAKRLDGTNGKPLSNIPNANTDSADLDEFFSIAGTCPRAADLNGDGKLDMVAGCRFGTFYYFNGLGEGKFDHQPKQLMVNKQPLSVSGHSDPFFVDWDADGDIDMLSGAERGGIFLSTNQGTKTEFKFDKFTELVAPHRNPTDGMLNEERLTGPGGATRVCAEDLNGDGKFELIVGDTITLTTPAKGLTEDEAIEKLKEWDTEFQAARDEVKDDQMKLFDLMDALYEKSDEETGEFADKADEARMEELDEQLEELNAVVNKVRSKRHAIVRTDTTGFVWVYASDTSKFDANEEEADNNKADSNDAARIAKPYGPIENRADVLIITNSELAEVWKPFADWKTSTGRPAKIISTKFIAENFSGKDIQQKIRACCLEHIDHQQTKWVILGGDSSGEAGVVPDRDTDHTDCEMLSYADIPTDLYYISEKDWDANGDGRYGVFADDMEAVAYFNPNATIGRIPMRTTADVEAYTDKVIAYESHYPIGDFARRMVYTCPENGAYPKLETSISQVNEAWPAGYVSRFFGDQTAWDDARSGDHDLTPDNWIKMINNRQASKIHMHGHGVLELWVLENNKTVKKNQVAKLTNENAYPVITTVSCLTGQYDDKEDPCITESMLRQPKSGAIAILAPSREGVPFFKKRSDFRLMMTEGKMDGTTTAYTKFWNNALSEDLTLGEAFRKVKMEMDSDARENDGFHMAQCELNLLGDPSLSARPAPPQSFKGRARLADNTLKLRGFPNAQVCIWDGGVNYMLKQSDRKGRLEVELPSTGKYHVTATAPGFNIWTSTVGEDQKVKSQGAELSNAR